MTQKTNQKIHSNCQLSSMFKYDVPPFVKSIAAKQVASFLDLSQDQQETFMLLLPDWVGSVEDLIGAAIHLSPPAGTGE